MIQLPQITTETKDRDNPKKKEQNAGLSGCFPSVSFLTLGCRLNQYESDALASSFTGAGYEVLPPGSAADIFIVNTCSVTSKADAKSRQAISKIFRSNPEADIYVSGCYATTNPEDIEILPGVKKVVSNSQKAQLFSYISGESPLSGEDRFSYMPGTQKQHTRAYLKVQDGCNNRCSFCKIPNARGPAQSFPFRKAMDHLQHLVAQGYREITLTGINLADYQSDDAQFSDLLTAMLNYVHPRGARIRISSVEPNLITPSVMDLFDHPSLCNHLHMPLQSGSNNILTQMERHYNREEYLKSVDYIKENHPKVNMTTDIMVGFPGETDKDFDDSLEIVYHAQFYHVHTFRYSPRANTKAAKMPFPIDSAAQTSRSQILRTISHEQSTKYRSRVIGEDRHIIIENITNEEEGIDNNNIAKGMSDDWLKVKVEGAVPKEYKDLLPVKLIGNEGGYATARYL